MSTPGKRTYSYTPPQFSFGRSTSSPSKHSGVWRIAFLRFIFFAFFVFSFDKLLSPGTSPVTLSIAVLAGILLASRMAIVRINFRGILFFTVAGAALYFSVFYCYFLIPYSTASTILKPFIVKQHSDLFFLYLALSLWTTWLFWKFRLALTCEILFLAGFFISLLSGHREYRFDMVKYVNTLAWQVGVSDLVMFVLLGSAGFGVVFCYLYASTLPFRNNYFGTGQQTLLHKTKTDAVWTRLLNSLVTLVVFGVVTLILYLTAISTYNYHKQASSTLLKKGVGDKSEEGLTPLDFHSALGGSSQPAALVRLEGDYPDNPFTPMLYIRESALSRFDGHQMVISDKSIDSDVSFTPPEASYYTEGDKDLLLYRIPVTQSVFLLATHKLAFAIDYPLTINRLKLTKSNRRFKVAYRAYSMAPSFQLEDLQGATIGNPNWPDKIRRHYLTPHPDQRYADFAEKISHSFPNPVAKAFALTEYLSQNAIYTLSPNHKVGPDDDKTAPFLFGDLRGYCVHFSHALVYLFRSLGIPARIGTGYLTDLSQAKDGHILLRMTDRHAWAEIYIAQYGWIPFDIQPQQVESHAEKPVDQNLLEELMGLLEPGEEILPEDLLENESSIQKPSAITLPALTDLLPWFLLIILLVFAVKFYLHLAWLLPSSPARKIKRLQVAVSSFLYDLGLPRLIGETRLEFQERIKREAEMELDRSTAHTIHSIYSRTGGQDITSLNVEEASRETLAAFRKLSFWKKFRGFLNPSSTLSGLGGWKW